jgi:recombinational DNA repair protein RecR
MYTPQFSDTATISVRRLAWSLGVSMPKAVDQLVNKLPSLFPPGVVCPSCKDNTKCKFCAFNQQSAAVLAVPAV